MPRKYFYESLVSTIDAHFRYLSVSKHGHVIAQSLREKIPENERTFNDVWEVISAGGSIYFITTEKIFRLHLGVISILTGSFGSSQSIIMNGQLFLSDRGRGFSLVVGDQIHPLPQFDGVGNGGVVAMAQKSKHEILVVRNSGDLLKLDISTLWNENFLRYEPNENRADRRRLVAKIPSDIGSFLTKQKASAARIYRVDHDHFAIATRKAGIIIIDGNGNFIRGINKQNGLVDNTVANIYVDRTNNLWVSTNIGISYVEYSVPLSFYGDVNGLEGAMLSSYRFNGRIYVGSFQRILVEAPLQLSTQAMVPKFVPIKDRSAPIWRFLEKDDDLLVASSVGLMQVKGDEALLVYATPASAYSLVGPKKWPHHAFLGGAGFLAVFKHEAGRWHFVGKLPNIKGTIRYMESDDNGDLWLSTQADGLLFCKLTDVVTEANCQKYSVSEGLPIAKDIQLKIINGRPIAATQKGVFRAIPDKSQSHDRDYVFIADPDFSKFFNHPALAINDIREDGRGGVLVSLDDTITWLAPDSRGQYQRKNGPFQSGPITDVPIFVEANGVTWISSIGLTRIDPSIEKDYTQSFSTLIRKVTARNKGEIFGGAYGQMEKASNAIFDFDQTPHHCDLAVLSFSDNALRFEFSATYFEKGDALRFRSKLKGFDDDRSSWGKFTAKEYSYLPPGDYKFRVHARNAYGVESSEASYTFSVLPPWYRTWWATLLGLILGVGTIAMSVKYYTQRLVREKQILEQLVAVRTRELREASLTDPLTGLRNRRFIGEILHNDTSAFIKYKQHLLKSKNKRSNSNDDEVFGVYLLDLDHFKQVNDTYGHEGGDRVLKQFAQVLTSSVRDDDAVIRLGGEEFLIVLKKTQISHLHIFAKTLLQKVSSCVFDVGDNISITKTCSIGYTVSPPQTPAYPT